ncbi:unnamed protein product [Arctogadus glacialis]
MPFKVRHRSRAAERQGRHSVVGDAPLFKSLHRMWESIGQEVPGLPVQELLLDSSSSGPPRRLSESVVGAASTAWSFIGMRSYKRFKGNGKNNRNCKVDENKIK